MEFACIFYDVFDVGGSAGSSLLEVSLLFCWHTSPASSYYIIGSCLVLLFVSFGAYGHLHDKLEFIENGVHMRLL